MKLELANGEISEVTDINAVKEAIDQLDKKNKHIILSDGNNYIQTAWLGHDLFETEYRDDSGYFQAKNQDLDLTLIKDMFEGFFNNTREWKNLTQWELIGNENLTSSTSNGNSGNFKDNLVDGLKRDAISWGKRKLRNLLKF